ncbi:4Fe-4S binding protein [Microlunatus sp. GCM10028923]|uniref:4Fe-4S binding protein n=1 Tax=Microlunatus sp. GCM10028923 TaxID=3273400 RepID=UPI0036215893
MIEIVQPDRCVSCDLCIEVCPTDVFERGADGIPVIARQSDCQTCFMCESYCPTDALYVAPLAGPAPAGSIHTDPDRLLEQDAFGSYRAALGWGRGRTAGSRRDKNYLFTTRS